MTSENLNRQQKFCLNKTIQAALDCSAVTLKIMLGGEINIRISPASLRPPGVCVRLGLIGALEGEMFIDLPEEMAVEIVKTLTTGRNLSLLDEVARSALMELGNILASVFVGYFDPYPRLRTLPIPPEMSLVPLDIPPFAGIFSAEFCWNKSQQRGEVVVGLDRAALELLLSS